MYRQLLALMGRNQDKKIQVFIEWVGDEREGEAQFGEEVLYCLLAGMIIPEGMEVAGHRGFAEERH